jgi:hypothetical protein
MTFARLSRSNLENVGTQFHSLRHGPNEAPFSPAFGRASFGLCCRHFGSDLWTSQTADSGVRFSHGPVFSGALYLPIWYRASKVAIDRHLRKAEFEIALALRPQRAQVGQSRLVRRSRRRGNVRNQAHSLRRGPLMNKNQFLQEWLRVPWDDVQIVTLIVWGFAPRDAEAARPEADRNLHG